LPAVPAVDDVGGHHWLPELFGAGVVRIMGSSGGTIKEKTLGLYMTDPDSWKWESEKSGGVLYKL